MSDDARYADGVEIPISTDNAVLLLAAAEDLELDASVVRTTSDAFVVPPEVAKKSGIKLEGDDEKKPATKRTSAKDKE